MPSSQISCAFRSYFVATGNGSATTRLATTSIPIVTFTHTDPIGGGSAESLARPGGNVTGLTYHGRGTLWQAPRNASAGGISTLKRVGVLISGRQPSYRLGSPWAHNFETAAHSLGLRSTLSRPMRTTSTARLQR